MTVRRVDTQVKNARRDTHVTKAEARKITNAAEKKPNGKADAVSNAEGKRVGEFYESSRRTPSRPPPGATFNPPPPSTNHPTMEQGARQVFNEFFVRNALPYGENEEAMRNRILFSLEQTQRGDPLPRKPRTTSLHEVFLKDDRPVDGEKLTAFLDAKKNRFYLRSEGMSRAGSWDNWYGPVELQRPMVSINPPRPQF